MLFYYYISLILKYGIQEKLLKTAVFPLRVNQNTMYKCYPESYV